MRKNLSKKEKTLITLYKMTNGVKKAVHYEDLLVETFNSFKKDFQLKRYPQYPDSDVFRYIIYFQLKPAGFIRIANKTCMLTYLGIKECKKLLGNLEKKEEITQSNLSNEIQRMISLIGYIMFVENKTDKIIDQDFFDFFKSSVRTKPLELLGNINQVNDVINEYSKMDERRGLQLRKYSEFLRTQFIHLYEGVKK